MRPPRWLSSESVLSSRGYRAATDITADQTTPSTLESCDTQVRLPDGNGSSVAGEAGLW
jgi:hypothetical protein